MGAVAKPVSKVVQQVGKVVGVSGGGDSAPAPAAPAAEPAKPPAAPSAPLAQMAQAARDMVGGQMRRRGRAANILAGEGGGAARTGQKRLLGE
jgi:hypothetical protein